MGGVDKTFGIQAEDESEAQKPEGIEEEKSPVPDLGIEENPKLAGLTDLEGENRLGLKKPKELVDLLLGLPQDFEYKSGYGGAGTWLNEEVSGTFNGKKIEMKVGVTQQPHGTIDGEELSSESAEQLWAKLLPAARFHGSFMGSQEGAIREVVQSFSEVEQESHKLQQLEERVSSAKRERAEGVKKVLEERLKGIEEAGGLDDEDKSFLEEIIREVADLETAELESLGDVVDHALNSGKLGEKNPTQRGIWTLPGISKAQLMNVGHDELEPLRIQRKRRIDLLRKLMGADTKKGQPWGNPIYGQTDFVVHETIFPDIIIQENSAMWNDDTSRPNVSIERNNWRRVREEKT